MKAQCKALTKAGAPCRAWAIDDGYCLSHSPGRAALVAAARRAGGKARHGRTVGTTGDSAPVQLQTLSDVLALLQRTATDLSSLENSVSRGRALVAVAQAWASCYETSEMERRIAALEQLQRERH